MIEQSEIEKAKESLKATIKFCRAIMEELTNKENGLRAPAFLTAWCLHNYVQEGLPEDVARKLQEINDTASNIIVN